MDGKSSVQLACFTVRLHFGHLQKPIAVTSAYVC